MNTSMATRPARAATGRASAASRQWGSRASRPLFEPLKSQRVLSTLYVSTTGSDTKPGTAGAPKVIKSDAGATVVLNTPSPLNKHASNVEVQLFGGIVTDWVVEGFEVANGP